LFEPSVYKARRAALIQKLAAMGIHDGVALFPGNRESPMNYADNTYRFRQDSSFLYYFGLAEPGMAAAIDLASEKSVLFADDISLDDMVWTGPKASVREQADSAGIDAAEPLSTLSGFCAAKRMLYLPPYRMDIQAQLAELTGVALGAVPGGASMELIRAVIAMREIKEDREIERIERAVDCSIDMHLAVITTAKPGMSEAQLMALAYREALTGGGMPSFPPIATTCGAVLHNHGYGNTLTDGGLFLLDAGAETDDGYSGDLTSTFPIGRRYNDRQRAVYQIVLDAGRAASQAIAPGVPYRQAHFAAARVIAQGLKGLGLMKGDMEAAVADGAHALFFPHGVGHQMGLDVHDLEALGEIHVGYPEGEHKSAQFGLKSLRMAKPVRAGMVLTVEPGIYFIEGLIDIWKREGKFTQYINYAELESWRALGGFRNEEDWLVSQSGARRLGKPFDKSIAAMEGYRGA